MDTEAKVIGQADFRTVYRDSKKNINNKVDIDERYSGDFAFKRMTRFTGVAKYNRPHITLTKEAKVDLLTNTYADYRITIENNGDHSLGPVYVKDIFPDGTDYVYSSLRPAELTDGYANWTLLSLGIGSKVVIDLRLNITQESPNLVNRVQAAGMYSDGWVTAGTFSAVQLNWLTSFPPQISASKVAWIDSKDSAGGLVSPGSAQPGEIQHGGLPDGPVAGRHDVPELVSGAIREQLQPDDLDHPEPRSWRDQEHRLPGESLEQGNLREHGAYRYLRRGRTGLGLCRCRIAHRCCHHRRRGTTGCLRPMAAARLLRPELHAAELRR